MLDCLEFCYPVVAHVITASDSRCRRLPKLAERWLRVQDDLGRVHCKSSRVYTCPSTERVFTLAAGVAKEAEGQRM